MLVKLKQIEGLESALDGIQDSIDNIDLSGLATTVALNSAISQVKAEILDGVDPTMDTLKEIQTLYAQMVAEANADASALNALLQVVNGKVAQTEYDANKVTTDAAIATADGKAVAAQGAADAAQDAVDDLAIVVATKASTASVTTLAGQVASDKADQAIKDGQQDQAISDAATAASTADGKAVAAQTTANSAVTEAGIADGKAVAAQTTADSAVQAAGVADGKAVAAQSTADSAVQAASVADGKAVTAQNAVDSLTTVVSGKASQSSVDTLSATVDTKAATSVVNAIDGRLTTLESTAITGFDLFARAADNDSAINTEIVTNFTLPGAKAVIGVYINSLQYSHVGADKKCYVASASDTSVPATSFTGSLSLVWSGDFPVTATSDIINVLYLK